MADIEKRIAEMPKPANPADSAAKQGDTMACEFANGFEGGALEQRKLLAEQGWVRLPSEEKLITKLADIIKPLVDESGLPSLPKCLGIYSKLGEITQEGMRELHRWLQEREGREL